MSAKVQLLSDAPVKIAVTLARHDHSRPYEGATLKATLVPGKPWAGNLKHRFQNNHPNLKIQFEILECQRSTCTFEIKEMSLHEVAATTPTPAAPVVLTPDSFAQANRPPLGKKYHEALAIYEALAAREPLAIYRNNAPMCALKHIN